MSEPSIDKLIAIVRPNIARELDAGQKLAASALDLVLFVDGYIAGEFEMMEEGTTQSVRRAIKELTGEEVPDVPEDDYNFAAQNMPDPFYEVRKDE